MQLQIDRSNAIARAISI